MAEAHTWDWTLLGTLSIGGVASLCPCPPSVLVHPVVPIVEPALCWSQGPQISGLGFRASPRQGSRGLALRASGHVGGAACAAGPAASQGPWLLYQPWESRWARASCLE